MPIDSRSELASAPSWLSCMQELQAFLLSEQGLIQPASFSSISANQLRNDRRQEATEDPLPKRHWLCQHNPIAIREIDEKRKQVTVGG
ncbi:hypothetical protein CH63R_13001 [Colletotrichum higginsianum IMI 349063]|uniref:Uncharacterized protein n=1 Tax=Colletotrichum higginsianum (strain IMI 349063) TaxID=759273 RepID=A0A1B7XVV4_COLHI|nr:hypothetical protein CH63R_13001 [Colletotrichum higginsianum IMI 349063]OBR03874.1 hypothetical protein CH63R_13001 [Colletotrichum higginsianum IMI 349063]